MYSRRHALRSALFGTGLVGLRALATGLPTALLASPRRALADVETTCASNDKAQFFIFSTSGNGDPLNASVPGTYDDPGIVHSPDPAMAAKPLSLAGKAYKAAAPWAALPQATLDRTVFWHLKSDTTIHSKEPDVVKLMGGIRAGEMLPSLLAKNLAPCLGTLQSQPISLGATSPSEGLTYAGQAQPILPALALKATLTSPKGPLTDLQSLRDQTLGELYGIYKDSATQAQRDYVDALVTSQRQVRNIEQNLLEALAAITDNSAPSQIKAAVVLIQMKVTPVVAIHIPFGGDNHRDIGLVNETEESVAGIGAIGALVRELEAANLTDKVTLMSLNVFGRTLGAGTENGRNHNPNHQASFTIGKPFRGGVVGGVGKIGRDYGAVAFDAKTGRAAPGGDVTPDASLASFGRTMLAAVGVSDETLTREIPGGKVVTGALA